MSHKIPTILVVDDSTSNLDFLTSILRNEGYCTIVANNGYDAIKLAKSSISDLILLDIVLPDIDGFEVCKILKKDIQTSDIPVIFITAQDDYEFVSKGFSVGGVDYIHKPFNINELLARVKTHLELKFKTDELIKLNQELEERVKQRTLELELANKELFEAHQALKNAYEKLAQLDKAKEKFIRHINHELRTPLQGIQGFGKILEDAVMSDEAKEYVKYLNQLIHKLNKAAEFSLLYTEIKADNYVPYLSEINLNKCIKNVVKEVSIIPLTVNFKIDCPNDLMIFSDEILVKSCLYIFIENAVKYSPVNGNINIEVIKENKDVKIIIQDEGSGFSVNALNNLFTVFFTEKQDESDFGIGLGLATARVIVDMLSGSILIKNNNGARIELVLPNNLDIMSYNR